MFLYIISGYQNGVVLFWDLQIGDIDPTKSIKIDSTIYGPLSALAILLNAPTHTPYSSTTMPNQSSDPTANNYTYQQVEETTNMAGVLQGQEEKDSESETSHGSDLLIIGSLLLIYK